MTMHRCYASSRLHKGAPVVWDVRDEDFPWTDEPESTRLTIEVDGAVAAGSGARRRALEEVTTRRALHVHARGGTGVTEGLRARRSAHGTRRPGWLVGLLGSFRTHRH